MEDKYYNEEISELERKELENLGLYSDEEEENINNNNNNDNSVPKKIKEEKQQISIFKSTDFNDFPKSDTINTKNNQDNNDQKFIKNKINIRIKKMKI